MKMSLTFAFTTFDGNISIIFMYDFSVTSYIDGMPRLHRSYVGTCERWADVVQGLIKLFREGRFLGLKLEISLVRNLMQQECSA